MNNKKTLLVSILITLVIVLCAVILVLIFYHPNRGQPPTNLEADSDATTYDGNQDLPQRKEETKQIAIPGIESLVFIAGQTEQKVNFFNPDVNDCLFRLTLSVDNEPIWQSGYIEPGKGYYTISLDNALEVGEYKATLLYECFKSDGTTLNSANVAFPLYVQQE